MPLGGNILTKGQVELVKRWINTGALKDDRSLSLSILSSLHVKDITTLLLVEAFGNLL
jgi:hypothetical protein